MPGGAHENMRGWSPEEDEMLLQLIETSGKRWKLIAEALGNANPRTPAMVRNRYLRIERGRFLTEQGMSKNRCGQCGELKRGHVCRVPRALIETSLSSQHERHLEARRAEGAAAPGTPGGGSDSGLTTLALGAPPLTMPFPQHSDSDAGPASVMSSPGPLSCGLALGLSPIANTTPGGGLQLGGLGSLGGLGGLGGPPSLRQQNSMDILLQASDLHRIRATESTPTPTPLASNFDSNPFKLPSVSAADLPLELQTEPAAAPLPPAAPMAPAAATPKGCAEEAAEADRASQGSAGPENLPPVLI